MIRIALFLFITAAILGGCVSYRSVEETRLQGLTERYANFDLKLAWSAGVTGAETEIGGMAKNVRYARMDDLEIWVSAPDPGGKGNITAVAFVIPLSLMLDESAPFRVRLPAALPPGTKLEFTYRYRAFEGGNNDGFFWMQSFVAEMPTGKEPAEKR